MATLAIQDVPPTPPTRSPEADFDPTAYDEAGFYHGPSIYQFWIVLV